MQEAQSSTLVRELDLTRCDEDWRSHVLELRTAAAKKKKDYEENSHEVMWEYLGGSFSCVENRTPSDVTEECWGSDWSNAKTDVRGNGGNPIKNHINQDQRPLAWF